MTIEEINQEMLRALIRVRNMGILHCRRDELGASKRDDCHCVYHAVEEAVRHARTQIPPTHLPPADDHHSGPQTHCTCKVWQREGYDDKWETNPLCPIHGDVRDHGAIR